MSLKLADMRAESSFRAGIAPAGDNKWKVSMLIVKYQILYPFAQGFVWAVLKDWMVVARLWASTSGTVWGKQLRERASRFVINWFQLNHAPSGEVAQI